MNDAELLQSYARNHSEAAFAELVGRYLDFVYSAAMRQVNGDAHLAQDVTQSVFIDLARKAVSLSGRTVLTGWLYTSTRYAAAKAVRSEQRRHTREQEAHVMQELLHEPAAETAWENLCPVLDDVMHELDQRDRNAVLLRYFEGRQLADVGARLGLSEDAARMRVDRALDKLRALLTKRGVTSTTAALAAILANQTLTAAPAGMAATITGSALAGAGAGGGAITLFKIITMSKLQASIAGTVAVVGVATQLVIQHQAELKLRAENAALHQQADQLAQLSADNGSLSNQLTQARVAQARYDADAADLLKLRAEVRRLRQSTNELNTLVMASRAGAVKNPSKLNTSQDQSMQNDYPSDSWKFSGYATPDDALTTSFAALRNGDLNTFLKSLTPKAREGMEKMFENGTSERDFAQDARRKISQLSGFRILDRQTISDDEILLRISMTLSNGQAAEQNARMSRIDNEWRFGNFDSSANQAN